MDHKEQPNLPEYLAGGRQLLHQASQVFERQLHPADYWWLGVGLAAITLAELSERDYAIGRIEQLVTRMGHKGVTGDWLQRFVEELAELDAEGLLWPVYERSAAGPIEPTGAVVSDRFDAEAGYFLALGHIGIALAVHHEAEALVGALAGQIGELVEEGLHPGQETALLSTLEQVWSLGTDTSAE